MEATVHAFQTTNAAIEANASPKLVLPVAEPARVAFGLPVTRLEEVY